MPQPIDIIVRIRSEGDQILDVTASKVEKVGQSAAKSRSPISDFARGFTDVRSALDTAGDAFKIVDDFEKLGTASIRAKMGLDALSGGQSVEFLTKMRGETRGLVSDFELTSSATKALALRLVDNADKAALLAKAGAILGQTMGKDASLGVETLTVALSRVNQTMLLDNIGLDAFTITRRFKELKEVMSDEQGAWSMAVLEDAARKVDKLSGTLDAAGTAAERLRVRFENFKRGAAENVTYGLEGIIGNLEKIDAHYARIRAQNAEIEQQQKYAAQTDLFDRYKRNEMLNRSELTQIFYGSAVARPNTMYGPAVRGGYGDSGIQAPPGTPVVTPIEPLTDARRYGGRAGLSDRSAAGQYAYTGSGINPADISRRDAEMANQMAMWKKLGAAGGTTGEVAWQTNQLYEAAEKEKNLREGLKLLGGVWDNVTGRAQAHLSVMNQIVGSIREQVDLTERRSKIQSVDQAFGLKRDGLYGEFGSGMAADAQAYRDRVEADLRKRIGTASRGYTDSEREKLGAYDEQATANRRAYQEQLYAESHAKGYKRLPGEQTSDAKLKAYDKQQAQARAKYQRQQRIGGKVYTKKDYESDLAKVDREIKQGMDEYAIATGAATKESIAFRDLQASISKQMREGSISTIEQAKAYLAMTNAMKDGKVSMEEYYDLQYKFGTPDQKKQVGVYRKHMADEERFEGKPKGKDDVDETRPYETVAASADKARKSSLDLATQGMATGLSLVAGATLAAAGMSPTISQIEKTIGKFRELEAAFSGFVGQMTITVETKGGGGGRDSTGATNAGQGRRGQAF
jgi:hypothetical protein